MKISIAVAMTNNHVIGTKNSLPWYIPEDLKKFRELTTGHVILMGRKTFESLPKVLPDRDHIVITRDSKYKEANLRAKESNRVFVVNTPFEAIEMIKNRNSDEEVFIIGGGEIYNQMLPLTDRLYITEVKESVDGDTYFPEINPSQWNEVERQIFERYDFVIYDRIP